MKTTIKLTLLIALFSISITANSQKREAKVFQMCMYANVGTKILDFKNLEKNNIIMPKAAFSLGAGAYWSFKNILWSSDFYYSQAQMKNSLNQTNYNAFTNSFYVSYKVIDRYNITLAPLVGMAMTTNKVSVANKSFTGSISDSPNAYKLIHHDNAIRIGINFETVVYMQNSVGITLGYDYSLSKEAEWKIAGTGVGSGISDNFSGFFINLNIGGRLWLTKGMDNDTENSVIIE